MKIFQKVGFVLVFILASTIFVIAQTEKEQTDASCKIGVVNSDFFKDKDKGIKDFVKIYAELDSEFKSRKEELKFMMQEVLRLEKGLRIVTHDKSLTEEILNNRQKDYQLAEKKFKAKQEEVRLLYTKREAELTVEIKKKISETLNSFAKEKGYGLILDISKLNESFILAKYENADVTDEFIKYYNSLSGKQQ